MLIDRWEKFRGYDKWIETAATVESSKESTYKVKGGEISESSDVLMWTDEQQTRHRTSFTVSDGSPLYQLVDGSTVQIRYNPADPENYYIRGLLEERVRATGKVVAGALILIAFAIVTGLLKSR
jgi:hypothetical protein